MAKLPGRRIIEPEKVPSGSHVWWSESGNDFGCTPAAGTTSTSTCPRSPTLPAGTPVKLTFKSYWDIEWDYDYGFVMAAVPGDERRSRTPSLPSVNGYTTPRRGQPEPRTAASCSTATGSRARAARTRPARSRSTGCPEVGGYPEGGFLDDEYDLTAYAGTATTAIRLSYSTDPGLARPGWFIDDLKITTGDGTVLYSSDFESGEDEPAIFNGGCRGDLATADRCTAGWRYVNAADLADVDHAYYLEMRDRSGFDADRRGRERPRRRSTSRRACCSATRTRSPATATPARPTGDAPNQSPLDSQPQPGAHDAEPERRGLHRGGRARTRSRTRSRPPGPAAGSTTTRTRRRPTPTATGTSTTAASSFDVERMSGTDIAAAVQPAGERRVHGRLRLRPFDYGYGVSERRADRGGQAKPATASAGEPVALDGSGSYDDDQAGERARLQPGTSTATARTTTAGAARRADVRVSRGRIHGDAEGDGRREASPTRTRSP